MVTSTPGCCCPSAPDTSRNEFLSNPEGRLECHFVEEQKMKIETFQLISHYSKSQIFVQKFNLTKPQHFHEFFTQIFLTIFLVKSKLSTAKKPKTATFSRVFHPQKIDNFPGKSKLKFWTKNEDFEQCV